MKSQFLIDIVISHKIKKNIKLFKRYYKFAFVFLYIKFYKIQINISLINIIFQRNYFNCDTWNSNSTDIV